MSKLIMCVEPRNLIDIVALFLSTWSDTEIIFFVVKLLLVNVNLI